MCLFATAPRTRLPVLVVLILCPEQQNESWIRGERTPARVKHLPHRLEMRTTPEGNDKRSQGFTVLQRSAQDLHHQSAESVNAEVGDPQHDRQPGPTRAGGPSSRISRCVGIKVMQDMHTIWAEAMTLNRDRQHTVRRCRDRWCSSGRMIMSLGVGPTTVSHAVKI
ncbi:hypothetical protein DFH07DRAFT_822731 [Mycena maculata]|uniref:Uncharacterized protein n=1 Tax=Mycena maculata TaxID=230809 RepID=A0AAD7J1I3_9AGAR|nr:hypothetical protein DFH07DRAFT_822731 [Mycena maculata]